MTLQLNSLMWEAVEPERLADFWATALGWAVRPGTAGSIVLVPTDVTGFEVIVRPGAPEKVGQNRIHLDLTTHDDGDQDGAVSRLLAAGARPIDIGQRPEEGHVVLADPEGNELCVIEPGNRFLASCPRLGAVNCDGTAALGRFWSQALGWPLVWDQDEETAIQDPAGTGPKITWSGPPLMPRLGPERIHFHVAAVGGTARDEALAELTALGATANDRAACAGATPLVDVDGNPFCLLD